MAFPFGDHPKFGHFKTWCRQNGIKVQDAVTDGSIKVTLFTKSDGSVFPVTHVLDGEYLTPTFLGFLERRLGTETHWFSVDTED